MYRRKRAQKSKRRGWEERRCEKSSLKWLRFGLRRLLWGVYPIERIGESEQQTRRIWEWYKQIPIQNYVWCATAQHPEYFVDFDPNSSLTNAKRSKTHQNSKSAPSSV